MTIEKIAAGQSYISDNSTYCRLAILIGVEDAIEILEHSATFGIKAIEERNKNNYGILLTMIHVLVPNINQCVPENNNLDMDCIIDANFVYVNFGCGVNF
ncbi:hypothetical protein ACJX0J_019074 [Zea mays]